MNIPYKEVRKYLNKPVFRLVSQVADEMNVECYVIGGYVAIFFFAERRKISILWLWERRSIGGGSGKKNGQTVESDGL